MTHLTASDIARASRTPLRTARHRLARWRRDGGPVERVTRAGVGRRPWAVPLDAYCARVGLDADTVLAALAQTAEAA